MADYTFRPRWKEELVCESEQGNLVFEMTMGEATVYFPTAARWHRDAPDWAKPAYDEILGALRGWCADQEIPLVVEDGAGVAAERRS